MGRCHRQLSVSAPRNLLGWREGGWRREETPGPTQLSREFLRLRWEPSFQVLWRYCKWKQKAPGQASPCSSPWPVNLPSRTKSRCSFFGVGPPWDGREQAPEGLSRRPGLSCLGPLQRCSGCPRSQWKAKGLPDNPAESLQGLWSPQFPAFQLPSLL